MNNDSAVVRRKFLKFLAGSPLLAYAGYLMYSQTIYSIPTCSTYYRSPGKSSRRPKIAECF